MGPGMAQLVGLPPAMCERKPRLVRAGVALGTDDEYPGKLQLPPTSWGLPGCTFSDLRSLPQHQLRTLPTGLGQPMSASGRAALLGARRHPMPYRLWVRSFWWPEHTQKRLFGSCFMSLAPHGLMTPEFLGEEGWETSHIITPGRRRQRCLHPRWGQLGR